ncbi:LysM peptidoglycan-binding domain-containing protein [Fulvivirgaceae bacterium BMA12]|uniref:LysM peptidoglycan-binding domain-containing protein n=1 Tax=Agaribacillus aureus TaxID=3051825 RepID=A0ABT8L350_9BACT|nr:LysM peptidoglycan-binding domain-containing protein [Fulvivirgaceae bacterium BMA12]
MKSTFIFFSIILIAFHQPVDAFTPSMMVDSIGIETKDGKTYIVHRVGPGETLYSLSRRYNSSVAGILKSNPGSDAGIKIQQILKIPYVKKAAQKKGAITHVVKANETMFAISRKYGVRLTDIKNWNNLSGTALNVGQKLILYPGETGGKAAGQVKATPAVAKTGEDDIIHTVSSSQTLYSISRQYNVSMTDIKKWNNLDGVGLSIGQKLVIKSTTANKSTTTSKKQERPAATETIVANNEQSTAPSKSADYKTYETSMEEIKRVNTNPKPRPRKSGTSGFNKVVELGFAEVIKTEKDSKKWLALHRTAPIGTILRVKNEMNNLWVFVRVVGVLPETSVNDKVLIKISKTAYDKLGAINNRFPVEISYVP